MKQMAIGLWRSHSCCFKARGLMRIESSVTFVPFGVSKNVCRFHASERGRYPSAIMLNLTSCDYCNAALPLCFLRYTRCTPINKLQSFRGARTIFFRLIDAPCISFARYPTITSTLISIAFILLLACHDVVYFVKSPFKR